MDDELRDIWLEGYSDPAFWCRTFLPHWFPKPMPWVHLGILAILTRRTEFLLHYPDLDKIIKYFNYKVEPSKEDSEIRPIFTLEGDKIDMTIGRYTLILMPRGFSKTTLLNAVNIFFTCYADADFTFYLSETMTHAETQLRNVKRELESNDKIHEVYGSLLGPIWRQELIHCANGVIIGCQGRGGQVRGKNELGKRPSRIILDDVETTESVQTEEQLKKTRDWLYRDVMPALPQMNKEATIVALGTLLASDCLLTVLMRDPQWTTIQFGALLSDGAPLWPEMMSGTEILAKKASYALAGQLNSFYLEYMSTARNTEDQKFPRRMFRWGEPTGPTYNAIAIDPAISEKPTADMCAIVVCGMSQKGKIYVHETWQKVGAKPDEMIDEYFRMAKQWNCVKHGVESVAFQAALVHLMREEMFRKHRYFEPIPITHKQRKITRVELILQPRFAAGYIVFNGPMPELEQQLEDWPNGRKDLPDALAMAIALLDPYAAHAIDPETDLTADQYESLDIVLPGWRDVA